MEQSTTSTNSHVDSASFDSQQSQKYFTPDLIYSTPLTTLSSQYMNDGPGYQPYTLTPFNPERWDILPVFRPCSQISQMSTQLSESEKPPLLLSNVSPDQLNSLQKLCRAPHFYSSSFELIENQFEGINNDQDSFLITIYRQLLLDLSSKWQLSIPILDYNLARLQQCLKKCLKAWEHEERLTIKSSKPSITLPTSFSIDELPLILEFYLQMDVDLFYLKTCSFRRAKPIETTIFCSRTPDIRYVMSPCQKSFCNCCQPILSRRHPDFNDPIEFHVKQPYRFINGYQTILNCPANCETSHVVYALRCPCERFDYVGITSLSFRDCLTYHRQESNRILRGSLLGPLNTNRLRDRNNAEKERENEHHWLYQHTVQCPVAMQIFLDANPDYWCLIPMAVAEAEANFEMTSPRTLQQRSYLKSMASNMEMKAKEIMADLPHPPPGYCFSRRQRLKQLEFFSKTIEQSRSMTGIHHVDLYNAALIAVLPENCTELFRKLIHSLFITHADCNLNQFGRLCSDSIIGQSNIQSFCFTNLVRRPLPSL